MGPEAGFLGHLDARSGSERRRRRRRAGGGGGGGGRGGGRGGLGQGGTVKQTADALTVERTVGENKVTATYKLDGTESKNT